MCLSAIFIAVGSSAPIHEHSAPAQLDRLLLFGFLAMVATLICYVDRHRNRMFLCGLGICSLALAVFGFIQPRAWPLAILQLVYAGNALVRFAKLMKHAATGSAPLRVGTSEFPNPTNCRTTRLYRSFVSNN